MTLCLCSCIFQLLSSAMGSDCSYGLAESLYLCVQMEASQVCRPQS